MKVTKFLKSAILGALSLTAANVYAAPKCIKEGNVLMQVKRIDAYGPTAGAVTTISVDRSGRICMNEELVGEWGGLMKANVLKAVATQVMGPLYDPNEVVCLPNVPCIVPVVMDDETFTCAINPATGARSTLSVVRSVSGKTLIMRDLAPAIVLGCDDLTRILKQELGY